jgi:RNA polymerase sigma-70 factor (ECF subfamily)
MVEPHRKSLLAHCYRMLGSWTDAEDVLQEALLKAWNGLGSLQSEAALRSWLYQVATNACLSALRARKVRSVPQLAGDSRGPEIPVGGPGDPDLWVEPFPDAEGAGDLAGAVEARQSVTLGFILALQHLPAKQRAALLLCEVVGYQAAEVGKMLGSSATSVNSALARARATLEGVRAETTEWGPVELDAEERKALDRYRQAWEAGDVNALVSMLSREATFSMPPVSTWYQGKRGARSAMERHVFHKGQHFRAVATMANGVPAFILSKAARGKEAFEPLGVQLVWIHRGEVRRVTTFLGPELARRFLASAPRKQGKSVPR